MPQPTYKPVSKMTHSERTKYCLAYQDACRQYEDLLTKYVNKLGEAQNIIHKLTVKIMQMEQRQNIINIHAQETDSDTESESEPENEPDNTEQNEVVDLTE